MTFEIAKEIRLVSQDQHNGKTLTQICKEDIAYFNTLGNHNDPTIREAAAVIVEYVKASRKDKNNG